MQHFVNLKLFSFLFSASSLLVPGLYHLLNRDMIANTRLSSPVSDTVSCQNCLKCFSLKEMINHSPHFSVHFPRQWFPNWFGPCPAVNSQHYLHTMNHRYCQTSSRTPRKAWLCVPAVYCALKGHHLGHSSAKKQVIHGPQYSQNQVFPHHIRRRSETQENVRLPVSPV